MTRTYERAPAGQVRAWTGQLWALPTLPPVKEDAPCCRSRMDELNRLPIGYCSPECIRRPENRR